MLPLTGRWTIAALTTHVDITLPELGTRPNDAVCEESRSQWFLIKCLLRYPEPYYADQLIATVLDIHETITGRRETLFHDQRDDYVWERVVSDMDFAAETGALIIADHVKHPLPKLDEVMDTKFDSSTPPVAPSDETKSKFEIQFVDEVGEGIEGLELVFVHRGKEEKQKTDSSGVAKFTGEGSFGSVRLASIDSLRKLIEPRWLKARLPKPYQAKSIQQATLGSKFESIGLEAEQRHVVQLMPELGRIYLELYDKSGRIKHANKPYRITGPTAFAGETDEDARLLHDDVVAGQYKLTLTLDKTDYTTPVEVLSAGNSTPQVRKLGVVPRSLMASVRGFVFEKNKAFVMPAAIESLQEVRELFFSMAPSDVLIVGHADTTAEPKINDPLSLDRADCTQAMLLGDVDTWLDMYGTAMPEKQRWGSYEDGLMIAAMGDYALEPSSKKPVEWYQETRGLRVDGNCGTKTRTKLIEEYMGLVGEPLAKDADFSSKLTTHGCGENFPLDESGENLDPNPANPKDDAVDRRVEFFYFDTEYGIQPPVKGKNSAKGSAEYPKWREGAEPKLDFEIPGAEIELPLYDRHFVAGRIFPRFEDHEVIDALATVFHSGATTDIDKIILHPDAKARDRALVAKRLKLIKTILKKDQSAWDAYQSQSTVREVQALLTLFHGKEWPCTPGPIDDIEGIKTWTGIYLFQISSNRAFGTTLKVDGICGRETWAAILPVLTNLIELQDNGLA